MMIWLLSVLMLISLWCFPVSVQWFIGLRHWACLSHWSAHRKTSPKLTNTFRLQFLPRSSTTRSHAQTTRHVLHALDCLFNHCVTNHHVHHDGTKGIKCGLRWSWGLYPVHDCYGSVVTSTSSHSWSTVELQMHVYHLRASHHRWLR